MTEVPTVAGGAQIANDDSATNNLREAAMARADESLGRLLDLPVKPDQPPDRCGNAITLAIDGTVTAALVEALQAPPVPSKGQDAGPSVQAPNSSMSGVAVVKQLPKAPRAAPSEVDLTRARKNARLREVYEEVADAVPSGRYFFTWKLQLQSRQNAIVHALQATPEFKNVSEKEIIRRVKKNLRDTKTHSRNNNLYGKDLLEMDEKAEADRRDYLGLKHTTANNCDEARKNQLDRVHAVCAKYAKAVPSGRYYFTWSMQPKDAQEKIHEILSNTSEFCNLGDKDIVSSAQRKLSRIKEDARKDPTYTKEFELQDDEDERKWKKELAFMNAERKRQEKLANKKRFEKANGTGTPEILEPVLRTDPACSLHCDEDCTGDDEETLSDHTESRVDARLDEIDEIQAVNGLLSLLEAKKGSARPAKRKRETKTKTKTKKAGATHGAKKDEASEGSRDRGALKVKVLRANDASDLGDDGKSRDVMKAKTELPRAECPPEHDHEGDGVGGATSPFPFLFSGSDASVDDEKRSRREATIPIRYRR